MTDTCSCSWDSPLKLAKTAYNYIAVFAKMQFFKISVILCFSVDLLYFFYLFFLPRTFLSRFSTDLHQIWHECVLLHAIYNDESDFWKVQKPGHNGKKHRKIGQIFAPAVTISLVVTKRLKIFEKSFLRWHLGCFFGRCDLVFELLIKRLIR